MCTAKKPVSLIRQPRHSVRWFSSVKIKQSVCQIVRAFKRQLKLFKDASLFRTPQCLRIMFLSLSVSRVVEDVALIFFTNRNSLSVVWDNTCAVLSFLILAVIISMPG